MFGGGLNYLTQAMMTQPQGGLAVPAPVPAPASMPMLAPAPMQGGLAAAAPRTLAAITAAGETPVAANMGLYSETAEQRAARLASPPEWLQNFYDTQSKPAAEQFRATPEMSQEEIMRRGNASALDALSRQLGGRAIDIFENPYVNLRGSRPEDEFVDLQLRDNDAYRLLVDGKEVGKAAGREEAAALIDTIKGYQDIGGKKADIQLQRYNKPFASIHEGVPGYEGGYGTVFHDMPDPDGLGDFLLKTVLPIGVSFIPGIGPALGAKLGLAGKTAAAVGTGLASGISRTGGGLLSGDTLGESLKGGLISGATAGLTQGALGAIPGADKFLSGTLSAKGSSLGGALADLGPDAINVITSKLPSAAISGIASAAGSGLSNVLPSEGGVGAPGQYIPPTEVSGLNILADKIPTGSAFPGAAAGVSGIGQTALDILAQQPQQQAPQEQAPTPEEQIDVLANRYPDAIPTGALASLPDVIAQAIAQQPQQTPQEQAPETTEDEIVVTGRPDAPIVTGALPFDPIVTGITSTIPDLAVRPDVAPVEEQAPETTEDEIVVTGSGYTAPTGGLSGAVSSAVNNLLTQPQLPDPGANEMLVEANPIDDPAIGPPVNLFEQLQDPMSYDATTDPAEPEKTPLQKALTTGGRILTGLSILGGLAGGGGNPASGLGTGAAAIGTRASLDPVFGGQLPPARGIFAQGSRAPRVMGDIDYERYGYGPARSFFENVPETPEQYRAALAANAPRPMVAGAGTVGVPNFLSNFIPPTAGSPALQAVRRLAPGVSDAQIEAFLATPEGADFLAAIQEAETPQGAARGGAMAVKGRGKPPRDSYAVNGAGDGRSDEIPALLSDGEYVIDAETVALLGDGSGKAGAKRLDDLRVKIRKHKGRNLAKGRFSDNAKAPEKYLSGGRT